MKKKLLLALAAAAATLAVTPQAQARQGCGRNHHRNAHGRCVLNRHVRGPVFVVGRYYNGRGWWDGRRWYRHRYMHRGHWRYR